jgi:hypothetical protein
MSPEQREARVGFITASMFGSAMQWTAGEGVFLSGPRKGQPRPNVSTAERDRYMRQLAFERTSKRPVHEIGSKSLSWGIEAEPEAKKAYEIETGTMIESAPFTVHPRHPFIGASPDFVIYGAPGGGEIKSPHDEAVHVWTLLNGMPPDHMPQVQGNIWVAGLDFWDFCSFDPRAAEGLQLYRQRIFRDDAYIDNMERLLLQFEAELRQMVTKLDQIVLKQAA